MPKLLLFRDTKLTVKGNTVHVVASVLPSFNNIGVSYQITHGSTLMVKNVVPLLQFVMSQSCLRRYVEEYYKDAVLECTDGILVEEDLSKDGGLVVEKYIPEEQS
jgi:hypothetical protein